MADNGPPGSKIQYSSIHQNCSIERCPITCPLGRSKRLEETKVKFVEYVIGC